MQDRKSLISKLKDALEPLPFVYGLWLEGADALGKVDAFSDIDVWLDVEDGFETEAFEVIKKTLSQVGELNLDYEVEHGHPLIRQRFFRLAGSPVFLFLDVCIQSHSRAEPLNPRVDVVSVLFDEAHVIRFEIPAELNIAARASEIAKRFELFKLWFEKSLARQQYLEALSAYYQQVLHPLLELLRLKHCPHKAGFGFKHIYQDLPSRVCKKLERLCELQDLERLERNYSEACRWISKLSDELTASQK